MSISTALGERHELRLAQGTVEYREAGSGAPILFVHGAMVNGDLWRTVVPPLARGFRCITPDWPLGSHRIPMGDAADLTPTGLADLVADFIAAMRLDSVTVVASDTGGALTQLLMTRHPERIARVVLTPCDAFENFFPPSFRLFQLTMPLPGVAWVSAQAMRLPRMQRLPLAFGLLTSQPYPREILDSFLGPVRHDARVRRDFRRFVGAVDKRYTLEAGEKLRAFERPVLIVWSDDSRGFPAADARRLAEVIPQSRMIVVEHSRGFVAEDQPRRLAELIESFVAETAPSAVLASV